MSDSANTVSGVSVPMSMIEQLRGMAKPADATQMAPQVPAPPPRPTLGRVD